jgi:hypothetical protein
MLGGIVGVTLHYLRFGPKLVEATKHDGAKDEKGGKP